MNQTFHARIAVGQYVFILLITLITIHGFWVKHIWIAFFFMFLLVLAIERILHTTYRLTQDDQLILSYGRFSRIKTISLQEINSIECGSYLKIGRFAILRYVLVKYGANGKHAVLFPVKEDSFLKAIRKQIRLLSVNKS